MGLRAPRRPGRARLRRRDLVRILGGRVSWGLGVTSVARCLTSRDCASASRRRACAVTSCEVVLRV
eukprot:8017236-Alexandrium_andersonii.AAC.1